MKKASIRLACWNKLIAQSLKRDAGWKAFYAERMKEIAVKPSSPKMLDIFAAERAAEEKFQQGAFDEAVAKTQELIDKFIPAGANDDRGWYLQEMARYKYPASKSESNKLQINAHKLNRLLLKPKTGMTFEPLKISQKRIAAMKEWLRKFESNEAMILAVEDICSNLEFGVSAGEFEEAFNRLGLALGFAAQRPDKEWKEGPDNLWGLRDGEYLCVECKSEVELDRKEIYKNESGQMNNACAWFAKNYPNAKATNWLIIPTKNVSAAAGFNSAVLILRKPNLKKLVKNVRGFFGQLKKLDLNDIDDEKLQEYLNDYSVSTDDLPKYGEMPKES